MAIAAALPVKIAYSSFHACAVAVRNFIGLAWSLFLGFLLNNSITVVALTGLLYGATSMGLTLKIGELCFGVTLSPAILAAGMSFGALKSCFTFLSIRWTANAINRAAAKGKNDRPTDSITPFNTTQMNTTLENVPAPRVINLPTRQDAKNTSEPLEVGTTPHASQLSEVCPSQNSPEKVTHRFCG